MTSCVNHILKSFDIIYLAKTLNTLDEKYLIPDTEQVE
jgi:hypothetical protein